jgi:hypothetical protein
MHESATSTTWAKKNIKKYQNNVRWYNYFLLYSQESNSTSLETGLSKWKVLRNAALKAGAEGFKKIFLKVVSMAFFSLQQSRPELEFKNKFVRILIWILWGFNVGNSADIKLRLTSLVSIYLLCIIFFC